jgi:hypothetical protein
MVGMSALTKGQRVSRRFRCAVYLRVSEIVRKGCVSFNHPDQISLQPTVSLRWWPSPINLTITVVVNSMSLVHANITIPVSSICRLWTASMMSRQRESITNINQMYFAADMLVVILDRWPQNHMDGKYQTCSRHAITCYWWTCLLLTSTCVVNKLPYGWNGWQSGSRTANIGCSSTLFR